MSEKDSESPSGTDWQRLEDMTDEKIDYRDIPPLDDEFFKNAKVRLPKPKKTITIRLDADVLEWYRSQGKGYQTRINAILKAYKEAHQQH